MFDSLETLLNTIRETLKHPMRSFQEKMVIRAYEIAKGVVRDVRTVLDVTPGGGKSLGASLFARVMLEMGFVKYVVWVTPRGSLAEQATLGFASALGGLGIGIRINDNKLPLIRGEKCVGYATTYHSINSARELHQQVFDLHPGEFLLIIDEVHHLVLNDDGGVSQEQQRAWTEALEPLVAKAKHVLCMSGTLERWDRGQVPFITYERRQPKGGSDVQTAESCLPLVPVRHVEYTRCDALVEKAILPIEIKFEDGNATYRHRGNEITQNIGSADDVEVSRVIRTILADADFTETILRRGLSDWMAWREEVYPSRAIVVCADQDMAREVVGFIRAEFGVSTVLAISDETQAPVTLRKFRDEHLGDILVTVGMAYEGLDVPDCTHLICLTHIRSRPWIEQAFARISRVDWNASAKGIGYSMQRGFVYAPRDPAMQDIVDSIRREQEQGLAEAARQEDVDGPGTDGLNGGDGDDGDEVDSGVDDREFHPISAESTGVRHASLEEGQLSAEESVQIDNLIDRFPALRSWPSKHILELIGTTRDRTSSFVEKTRAFLNSSGAPPPPPPYDPLEEERLRKQIHDRGLKYDRRRGVAYGTFNQESMAQNQKSRAEMSVDELRKVVRQLDRLEKNAKRRR